MFEQYLNYIAYRLLILQFNCKHQFEAVHYCSSVAQTFVREVQRKLVQCLDV